MNEDKKAKYEEKDPNWENHPNTIEYRKIKNNINTIKQNIINIMEKAGFTQEEKQEILDIIEYHSMLKDAAKTPLKRVNKSQVYEDIETAVLDNGKKISDNMLKVLRNKLEQIMENKQ